MHAQLLAIQLVGNWNAGRHLSVLSQSLYKKTTTKFDQLGKIKRGETFK
jgi:hypothetical protein